MGEHLGEAFTEAPSTPTGSLHTQPPPRLPALPKGAWEFGAKIRIPTATIVKCLQPARHPAKSVSCKVLLRWELFSPLNRDEN